MTPANPTSRPTPNPLALSEACPLSHPSPRVSGPGADLGE